MSVQGQWTKPLSRVFVAAGGTICAVTGWVCPVLRFGGVQPSPQDRSRPRTRSAFQYTSGVHRAFIQVTASRLHANHIRLCDQGSGLTYLRHEDWFVVEHGDTSAGAGGFIGGFQYASRLGDVFP